MPGRCKSCGLLAPFLAAAVAAVTAAAVSPAAVRCMRLGHTLGLFDFEM